METMEKPAAVQNWVLDKAHAKVGFSITHMLVSEVDGIFKDFDVKISNAKEDLSGAQIEFTAQVKSIDTHNAGRNEHMWKEDFFDVEKFPVIAFKSTSFTKLAGKNYNLEGELTIKGVTKPVTLKATGVVAEHPFNKKTIAGFKVEGAIQRPDFNFAPSAPSFVLSNEVNIVVNAEFIKE